MGGHVTGPLIETDELVRRARNEYGEVITRIVDQPDRR